MIWTLAQSFGAAKLDLGEELPAVVEHVIEQVGAANASDDGVRDVGDSLWPFGSSCSAQLSEDTCRFARGSYRGLSWMGTGRNRGALRALNIEGSADRDGVGF